MKIGAEPKKVAALVGLFAVAGIVYWMNSSSDAPAAPASRRPATTDSVAAVTTPVNATGPKGRRVPSGTANIGDVDIKVPDKVDPATTDATLRLDLLAKVQSIGSEGGVRNIFLREAAPPEPVKVADTKPLPKVDKLHPNAPATPVVAPPAPPPVVASGPPPAAPINLKYYGYSTKRIDGEKKAFFLDGEDIIVAAEGEVIKKQYKIVKITTNSVQMEDTHSRSTQTLPIQQDAALSPA